MKRIWKFPLKRLGVNLVSVPVGSKLLSVGRQHDEESEFGAALVMWAETDTEHPNPESWKVLVLRTGEEFDPGATLTHRYRYVSTVTLQDDPPFVVHVYLWDRK